VERYSSSVGRSSGVDGMLSVSVSVSASAGWEAEGSGRVVRHTFSDHFWEQRGDQNVFFWPSLERSLFTRRIVLRSREGRYERIW
jgi:hypothetical protein